jgi:YHS domain-containing protein
MGFFGRILRFLFWILLVSWVAKLVSRLFRNPGPQTANRATADAPAPNKRLVRDPVCGMHLAPELALPLAANGETQFFCSAECRAKFAESTVERAASA